MVNLRYPVIGIPKWWWKGKACKYAKSHPRIVRVPAKGLCYECSRHAELLRLFDEGEENFTQSEYYIYQAGNKRDHKIIMEHINKFRNLYVSIKTDGCKVPAIVTEDGCRLDGSHRLSIQLHLGEEEVDVNLFKYKDLFSEKNSVDIMSEVSKYRRQIYNFDK